jgi:putative MATE family efflux protein
VIAEPTRRLLEGPVTATLLRLAAPNMAEAVARVAFITLDAYFVAWIGDDALAGISLVFPFFILMQTMSAGGMGGGIASAIARALGAGRPGHAQALALHAVVIALAGAALFTAAALLWGRPLYRALGAEGPALQAAAAYSDTVFAGALAVWLMNSLASVVRGTGNMLVPALAIVAAEAVHVLVAPALILGWGPVPRLGVVGAGLGVVASYAAGTLVLGAYLAAGRGTLAVSRTGLPLRRDAFADILKVGLPSSVNTVQFQITNIVLVGLVGGFGTLALAGFGAASRLEIVQIPVVFAFGAALVTLVGANVGAGQMARARRIAWVGAAVGGGISGAVGLIGLALGRQWMALFTSDPEVARIGLAYLRVVGPAYAFFGVGLALFFASQGAGRVLWPFLAVTARLALLLAGGALLLGVLGAGLTAVFWLTALSFVVFGALVALAFRAGTAW